MNTSDGARRGARPAVAAACLLAAAVAPAARAQDDDKSTAGKGRLEALAPVVRRLIPLTVDKGALRMDREAWTRPAEGKAAEDLKAEFEAALQKQGYPKEWAARQAAEMAEAPDAERIFNLLQVASRSHGTGRSMGGNERSTSFSGGGLAGRLSLTGTANAPGQGVQGVDVDLREEKDPKRSLQVTDDGEGALRLVASDGAGKFLLVINQARGGRFSVAFVEGDTPYAGSGESYQAFYRANRETVEKRLIPLLARLGVGTPLTAVSPEVRKAVLSRLRPVTEEERQEIDRRITGLDDADHAKREEATRFLAEQGHRHPARLEAAQKDASNSPEAAARLTRILAEIQIRRRADDLAGTLGLDGDPATLADLLDAAPEADRPLVVAALEKATGQKLGADAAAWKTWLESAKPAGANPKAEPGSSDPRAGDPGKGVSQEARIAAAKADLAQLATCVDMYEVDVGAFPSTAEGLAALLKAPGTLKDPSKWKGPYIREIPLDPWGMPYRYVYPGSGGPKTFDLLSAGPDKKEGTEDDISD